MLPKVSIIVPVYNTAKYLNQCLTSLIDQTLKDIEIIVVNDGSSDNSLEIIESFQRKDSRIKVISHKNIGLGPTRNVGIKIAKGEYLAFVDSDDYVDTNMYLELYSTAKEKNSDIVVCDFKYEKENNIITNDIPIPDRVINLNKTGVDNFFKEFYFTLKIKTASWNKLYRRSLILEQNITFEDNKIIFSEDNLFNLMCFHSCNIITLISKQLYYYRIRSESIMNNYKKNYLRRELTLIEKYEKYLTDNNIVCSKETVKRVKSALFVQALLGAAVNEYEQEGENIRFHNLINVIEEAQKWKGIKKCTKVLVQRNSTNYILGEGKKLFIKALVIPLLLNFNKLAAILLWLRIKLFPLPNSKFSN
jgi:glycosyltransferase involved in cell wall biosynthesis